jgi:hypothetical protein
VHLCYLYLHPARCVRTLHVGMQVIRNHIVKGYHDHLPAKPLTTLATQSTISASYTGSDILVASDHTGRSAKVIKVAKYSTCEGIVHIIDDILIPNGLLCSGPFQQCGGDNWNGPTCCAQVGGSPYSCVARRNGTVDFSMCECAPSPPAQQHVLS